jgi:2-polyprenyl-3-methyl-5-hydroxy-6-metoxy-1,4-benzoquinol methylase
VLICPTCRAPLPSLDTGRCERCSSPVEHRDGIPVLLSARDRSSSIFNAYQDHYDAIAAEDLKQSIQGEPYLRRQAEALRDELGGLEGLDVCDVGIGQGLLFDLLAESNPASLVGIDVAWPYLSRYAGREWRVILANAENIPYEDAFDLIVSTDVMEHILNIGDFLVSVYRALRPGGMAVLRAPNTEDLSMYATLTGATYRFVHLRTFTRRELQRQVRAVGFDIERTFTRGWWLSRRRRWVAWHPLLESAVNRVVLARFGSHDRVNEMDDRLARLLMRPNEITVMARRPG